jgi:arabinogalactan oligomer/maltooligosaccharide transport system substrate-binding protein
MIDTASYSPAALAIAQADGKTWGAPISFGNQLMLYFDKTKVTDADITNSDAWVAAAKKLTADKKPGLVFNQTESFWLVPFLGGYDGKVFAEDGKTPTLDTDAMKGALQFMYDLKYTDKVTPAEADYNVADGLFKDGSSPMIINGDWAMADYQTAKGDNLGVAPIPQISGKSWPAPYIAGAFWMASKAVGDNADMKCVVSDFFKWSTATDQQINMVKTLKRLPGNAAALADPVVTGDALLSGAAAAAQKGIPQPTNLEMRCVFDSMTAGVRDMFSGNSDIAGIAKTMQSSAETCISQQ